MVKMKMKLLHTQACFILGKKFSATLLNQELSWVQHDFYYKQIYTKQTKDIQLCLAGQDYLLSDSYTHLT